MSDPTDPVGRASPLFLLRRSKRSLRHTMHLCWEIDIPYTFFFNFFLEHQRYPHQLASCFHQLSSFELTNPVCSRDTRACPHGGM